MPDTLWKAGPWVLSKYCVSVNNSPLFLIWLTSRVLRQSITTQHASTWKKQFCFPSFLMWQGETQSHFLSCPSCSQSPQEGPTIQTCPPSQRRCWVKYVHLWWAAGRSLVATHSYLTDSVFSSDCSGSPGLLYGTFTSIILCCLLVLRDSVIAGDFHRSPSSKASLKISTSHSSHGFFVDPS